MSYCDVVSSATGDSKASHRTGLEFTTVLCFLVQQRSRHVFSPCICLRLAKRIRSIYSTFCLSPSARHELALPSPPPHFPEAGSAAVGTCRDTWQDKRIWMYVVKLKFTACLHSSRSALYLHLGVTRLLLACIKGDMGEASRLIGFGADVEAKCGVGFTPLIYASLYNHRYLVFLLLNKNANIEACTSEGKTALMLVCRHGHVEVIEQLLAHNANVLKKSDEGIAALGFACIGGHLEAAKLVLARGAYMTRDNDGCTPLMRASQHNQAAIIELLCDRHADINELNDINYSALGIACIRANIEAVRVLLARGANVDAGLAPIICACFANTGDLERRLQVVCELSSYHADFSAVDINGWTAVMHASCNNFVEIVRLLCDRHVNINAINISNQTALYIACYVARNESMLVLLEREADPNVGNPPLICACTLIGQEESEEERNDGEEFWLRKYKLVESLCAANADTNIVDADGQSALMMASRHGQAASAVLLLNRHAHINMLNSSNQSALWQALYMARVDMVHFLLAKGADVNLGEGSIIAACTEIREEDRHGLDTSEAIWARKLKLVRLLVCHNADLDATNAHGRSAIMMTARFAPIDIVSYLLEFCVDLAMIDFDGSTALRFAVYAARPDVVDLLLAKGADPNLGKSPILCACSVLEEEFEEEEVQMEGFWKRRLEICISLIEHGANIFVFDAQGLRPIDLPLPTNNQKLELCFMQA